MIFRQRRQIYVSVVSVRCSMAAVVVTPLSASWQTDDT